MSTEIFLACIPPKTTSQTKRLVVVNGKPRFFAKKAAQNAGNTLAALLEPHQPQEPLQGPLRLELHLTWPWRSSDSKKVRAKGSAWLPVRPDIDNSVKLLKDVMTQLAFWKDDAQIVHLTTSKQVGDRPGIAIKITQA